MSDDEYTIEITLRNGRRTFTRSTMLTFMGVEGLESPEEMATTTFNYLKHLGHQEAAAWYRSSQQGAQHE